MVCFQSAKESGRGEGGPGCPGRLLDLCVGDIDPRPSTGVHLHLTEHFINIADTNHALGYRQSSNEGGSQEDWTCIF